MYAVINMFYILTIKQARENKMLLGEPQGKENMFTLLYVYLLKKKKIHVEVDPCRSRSLSWKG